MFPSSRRGRWWGRPSGMRPAVSRRAIPILLFYRHNRRRTVRQRTIPSAGGHQYPCEYWQAVIHPGSGYHLRDPSGFRLIDRRHRRWDDPTSIPKTSIRVKSHPLRQA